MGVFNLILVGAIFSALVGGQILAAAGLVVVMAVPHFLAIIYTAARQDMSIRSVRPRQDPCDVVDIFCQKPEEEGPIRVLINKKTLKLSVISATTYGGFDFKEDAWGVLQSVDMPGILSDDQAAPVTISLMISGGHKIKIQAQAGDAKKINELLPKQECIVSPQKKDIPIEDESARDERWKRAVTHVRLREPAPPKPPRQYVFDAEAYRKISMERIRPWLERKLTPEEIVTSGHTDFAREGLQNPAAGRGSCMMMSSS